MRKWQKIAEKSLIEAAADGSPTVTIQKPENMVKKSSLW